MIKNNQSDHDEVREKISEDYKNWKKLKPVSALISNKFSEFPKVNKTLNIILKLVIFGDSMMFLLFVLFVTYWKLH